MNAARKSGPGTENAGRRAICPACRREFIFPSQSVPGTERSPTVVPPPQTEGEEVTPANTTELARPFWRDPIVVVGAAVPTLILAVFFGYLAWPHIRTSARPSSCLNTGTLRASIAPHVAPIPITNSIGMKLVPIPAGEFEMGSPENDGAAMEWELPQHRVKITEPFYLGAYEVTRGQFRGFADESGYLTDAEKDGQGGFGLVEQTGTWKQDPVYSWRNTGFDQSDSHPVVNVSWNDACRVRRVA